MPVGVHAAGDKGDSGDAGGSNEGRGTGYGIDAVETVLKVRRVDISGVVAEGVSRGGRTG